MKPILTAMMTIAFVIVAAGAGTWATFTDDAASNGNTFTAGILDLKIKNAGICQFGQVCWVDGVTQTWTLGNMKPGDETSGAVVLHNAGTIESGHAEISADYISTDSNPDWMAKNMVITYASYNNGGVIDLLTGRKNGGTVNDEWLIHDTDGDGRVSLFDLKNDPLLNLPPSNADDHTFDMNVQFYPGAGNDFQGDTLTLTVTFSLVQ